MASAGDHTLPLVFDAAVAADFVPAPTWVSDPALRSGGPIKADGSGMTIFGVTDSNREMKWTIDGFQPQGSHRYLVLGYRAENISTTNPGEYVLWGITPSYQTNLVMFSDLIQDHAWHRLAVDLNCKGFTESFSSFAVSVRTDSNAPGTLWLNSMTYWDRNWDNLPVIGCTVN